MLRVLLLDDETPARIAIRKLGGWDETITEFFEETDGQKALSCMEKHIPHIVFTDMNMPNMDGIEFLEKASVLYPDTCFIVVSGYDHFNYAKSAICAGAINYILKPVSRQELLDTVEKAIRVVTENGSFSKEADVPVNTDESIAVTVSPEEAVRLIKRDIDKNFDRTIRVSHYAKQYYFSQEYLTRLFRQRYEVSIQEYLLRVRMEKACELLSDPEEKVSDVALKVGYPDNNYFSKAFRAYFQISPSQYRANKKPE